MARKAMTDEQREKARERQRRYNAKPEVAARRAAYYQQPEVKARYKDRHATAEHKAYMAEWRKSEAGRRSLKGASLKLSTEGAFDVSLWLHLMDKQGGACAVCRRDFDLSKPHLVHADHCHSTKKARGLLCQQCNHAEGQIKATGLGPEEFGRRMSAYLRNPPAGSNEANLQAGNACREELK